MPRRMDISSLLCEDTSYSTVASVDGTAGNVSDGPSYTHEGALASTILPDQRQHTPTNHLFQLCDKQMKSRDRDDVGRGSPQQHNPSRFKPRSHCPPSLTSTHSSLHSPLLDHVHPSSSEFSNLPSSSNDEQLNALCTAPGCSSNAPLDVESSPAGSIHSLPYPSFMEYQSTFGFNCTTVSSSSVIPFSSINSSPKNVNLEALTRPVPEETSRFSAGLSRGEIFPVLSSLPYKTAAISTCRPASGQDTHPLSFRKLFSESHPKPFLHAMEELVESYALTQDEQRMYSLPPRCLDSTDIRNCGPRNTKSIGHHPAIGIRAAPTSVEFEVEEHMSCFGSFKRSAPTCVTPVSSQPMCRKLDRNVSLPEYGADGCCHQVDNDEKKDSSNACAVLMSNLVYRTTIRRRQWNAKDLSVADNSMDSIGCGVSCDAKTVRDTEDDGDNKLYCICNTRYDEDRIMIACDRCDEWYHSSCVGMTDYEVDLVDQFICPLCIRRNPNLPLGTTYQQRCLFGLDDDDPSSPSACHKPARGVFSKYCSDHCGIKYMEKRLLEWDGKDGRGHKLWDRVRFIAHFEGVSGRLHEGAAAVENLAYGKLKSTAKCIELLSSRLKQVVRDKEITKRDMEVVMWREKLVGLAAKRAEKFDQCGWDQRLCFGEEEWASLGEEALQSYDEEYEDISSKEQHCADDGACDSDAAGNTSRPEWWCSRRIKCDRHVGLVDELDNLLMTVAKSTIKVGKSYALLKYLAKESSIKVYS
ncbi:hypothetical protein SERLA73DRAFT_68353 [Serpula lacrymans var. lacrymans S7.3]|uniref:PHD-type domain-containing protein n=2 Tax=Serpula lacrymans var. lacrymans TaxID=341189 RepID=F8PF06_SERL3|nr:uncharacterized protein SERLADRAFT_432100 [Serpula lacrymans var. lacrymans S7.9]EGO04679.1 hypothetical protein SERLA73DRAFT_68353 [Serpula lacrymans var. lacrymans S7.3]EGO30530.1 hypothetical protein SERLADRAFT_432100 [Serpula lacrymans var. lacrymans S7.9]